MVCSLPLLHLDFRWPQEGPILLLLLALCICLEISPTVHSTIPTFLKVFLPFSFSLGFFLGFDLLFSLSLPLMHFFGFSLFPFNLQLSKQLHGLFVDCLFEL